MITNLFSSFDPCNFYFISRWILPWLILIFPILKNLRKFNFLQKKLYINLNNEFFNLSNRKLNNNLILPVFFVILLLNLISLIPSTFPITNQISSVLPIILRFWLTNNIYSIIKKINKFLIHLVPIGSPTLLIPILIIIEIIRNLIRPITLSVRLMANITAGHLLIHLLRKLACFLSNKLFLLCIPISIILTLLEFIVSIIQRYILCSLVSIYSNEIH